MQSRPTTGSATEAALFQLPNSQGSGEQTLGPGQCADGSRRASGSGRFAGNSNTLWRATTLRLATWPDGRITDGKLARAIHESLKSSFRASVLDRVKSQTKG